MSFLSSSQSTLASNLLDPSLLKEKEEKEAIIGIDLGTKFSCVGIMREGRVEIVPEVNSGGKIIPSIIGFFPEKCIGKVASEHILEYIKSIMYDSKRLIGHKFSNENVQNDISHWPIKITEDPKGVTFVSNCKVASNDIIVQITSYSSGNASNTIYETVGEKIRLYEVNGVEHYIMPISKQTRVLWICNNNECSIRCSLQDEDIYRMIDSIYER